MKTKKFDCHCGINSEKCCLNSVVIYERIFREMFPVSLKRAEFF